MLLYRDLFSKKKNERKKTIFFPMNPLLFRRTRLAIDKQPLFGVIHNQVHETNNAPHGLFQHVQFFCCRVAHLLPPRHSENWIDERFFTWIYHEVGIEEMSNICVPFVTSLFPLRAQPIR
jgi:hypothetical protein